MTAALRTLTLTEYETRSFTREELPDPVAETLWREHGDLVAVETPSFKNGERWRLTGLGWVGVLPLARGWQLVLRPRVPLHNLFRMIDYAYGIRSLRFAEDVTGVDALPELYARLAAHLAEGVLERCRRGLYGSYRSQSERTRYVQGQIHAAEVARAPWAVELPCRYEEQSVDVPENAILAWTLHVIRRSGLCGERTQPVVERALRALRPSVSLHPFTADACRHRTYSRLNSDYRPLHALCAFFLDHSGPHHAFGANDAPAFLVHMARLYEQFVAAWLAQHLPTPYRVVAQEPIIVESGAQGNTQSLRFLADLVLYDGSGHPLAVMDTKYKLPEPRPDAADVQQVLAYAHAAGVPQALLVYPTAIPQPLDATVNGIRVRSVPFLLSGDLAQCGQDFLAALSVRPA